MKTFIFILLTISHGALLSQASLNQPFEDCRINGSITIYDYNHEKWICNDIRDSHFGTLPASTFKILNTLIAIETQAVEDENEIIKWHGSIDKLKYGDRPNIYHDMGLEEAFRLSAGWVYVELAKEIGKDKYREYLTKINYGNSDVSIDDPDFWNFGNLAVTPIDQIELLIGVYEESLPFSEKAYRILKRIMIEEEGDDFILRAKTGWARNEIHDIGWWVGYIEQAENVHFFATRLIKDRDQENLNFSTCRKEITKTILRQLNMIE